MQTDKQTIFLQSLFKPYYYIETMDNVRDFLKGLISELGLGEGFHPDTPFNDYEGLELTEKQIERLEGCMGTAIEVCDEAGIDIYEISLKIMQAVWLEEYIADWEAMEGLESGSQKELAETMLIDRLSDFTDSYGFPPHSAEELLATLKEEIETL